MRDVLSTNYIICLTLNTEFNTLWFSPVFAKNHRLDPNLIHPGENLFSWWVMLCPLEVDMSPQFHQNKAQSLVFGMFNQRLTCSFDAISRENLPLKIFLKN